MLRLNDWDIRRVDDHWFARTDMSDEIESPIHCTRKLTEQWVRAYIARLTTAITGAFDRGLNLGEVAELFPDVRRADLEKLVKQLNKKQREK